MSEQATDNTASEKPMSIFTYIEDQLLARIQKRCEHPGNMVAADILEGNQIGLEVKHCRRCGSVKIEWKPLFEGQSSKFASLEHTWRRPDPNLWRG
jgi:hypothetical protein